MASLKRLTAALAGRGVPAPRILDEFFTVDGVDTQAPGQVALALVKRLLPAGVGADETLDALDVPLFHHALRLSVVCDASFEPLFIAARHRFLRSLADRSLRSDRRLKMMVSLACQCFNNEYIYPVPLDDRPQVEQLRARLEDALAQGRGEIDSDALAVYAMYAPLWTLRRAETLLGDSHPLTHSELETLIVGQIAAHRDEHRALTDIRSFSLGDQRTANAVRRQYEESPYPRWLSLTLERPRLLAETLARIGGKAARIPARPLNVLVAACGTGKHPIAVATRYSDVRVTAIDISATSLGYAARQARRYGVSNIEFLHGDLLHVEELGLVFDAIEAVGVLHHLENPEHGLRALSRVLNKDGFIKLGVYSRRARTHLDEFRRLLAESPDDDWRQIRQEMFDAELPGRDRLLGMLDFYYSSGFRDLLRHAHEVVFTPLELGMLLGRLGLSFLGYTNLDAAARHAYGQTFPEDPTMRDLRRIDQYEDGHPHLFPSLQIAWVQKRQDS